MSEFSLREEYAKQLVPRIGMEATIILTGMSYEEIFRCVYPGVTKQDLIDAIIRMIENTPRPGMIIRGEGLISPSLQPWVYDKLDDNTKEQLATMLDALSLQKLVQLREEIDRHISPDAILQMMSDENRNR